MSGSNEEDHHTESTQDPIGIFISAKNAIGKLGAFYPRVRRWRYLRTEAWIGHFHGLERWTLCFKDPVKEHGYLKACRCRLLAAASAIAVIALLISALWTFIHVSHMAADTVPTHAGRARLRMQLIACAFVALKLILVVIASQCSAIHNRIGESAIEFLLVVSICFVSVVSSVFICDQVFLSNLINASIADTWGPHFYSTDSTQLLVLIGILVATHIALPIRWHRLLWVQFVSLGPFAVRILFYGSPEEAPLLNLAMFCGIVGATSFGKRSSDLAHRKQFDDFVTEKSCRFAAEFKLDQNQNVKAARSNRSDLAPVQHDDESVSAKVSVPETTSTGLIFTGLGSNHAQETMEDKEHMCLRLRLEDMARLGEREGWLLEPSDVMVKHKEILGSGGFGSVLAATFHGTEVAVKLPLEKGQTAIESKLMALANELRVLRRVRHPNIVIFFGACIEPLNHSISLVMERVYGMNFEEFLLQPRFGNETYIRYKLMMDILSALRYLHSQCPQIVHGDLKPGNMLVVAPVPLARLLDFGLSRILTRNAKSLGGTLSWMAPEIIRCPGTTPKASSDVFSCGLLVYMITTSQRPFKRFSPEKIVSMARSGQSVPLQWPSDMFFRADELHLFERALESEPKLRPSMVELHAEVLSWSVPAPCVKQSSSRVSSSSSETNRLTCEPVKLVSL